MTGANTGLGRAFAIALASAGADIVAVGRKPPTETAAAVAAAGRRLEYVAADLAEAAPKDIVAKALEHFDAIDILVNNAGIIRRSPAADFSDVEWDEVIEVNLSSVFRLCRAAGRGMLQRRSGKIINIASLLTFQGGIRVPAYAAAKGGVAQLTKALANEWAGSGVNVNAIAPGYMVTDNTQALRDDPVRNADITARIPAGRWGDPADLAGAVVFLASSASDYVHGHVLVVDGGWMGR